MVNEVRREKEVEEMKQMIIDAAIQIMAKEGFDQVSVRKIARIIQYSPSIVYHYFKDKDEILDIAIQQRYQTIIAAIASVSKTIDPKQKLQMMTRNYIMAALTMNEEFLIAQLRPTKASKKHTSFLFEEAVSSKPALRILYECLKEIHPNQTKEELELSAQLITTSTLGLILKLIVEDDISEIQKKRLIDHYCTDVMLRIARC